MENNKKSEPYYDEYDAVDYIASETGIEKGIIRKVLNSELRYMHSIGIIDWDDLDEYIAELSADYYFKES